MTITAERLDALNAAAGGFNAALVGQILVFASAFGLSLYNSRRKAGLSRQQMAARMGISVYRLTRIERLRLK